MKKLYITLFCVVLCLSLSGCQEIYHVEGIENFKLTQGHFELNHYILPSEDFLEKYPYSGIQYDYKEVYKSYFSWAGTEYSLIVIDYSSEQYALAKAFCLQEMVFLKNTLEYNNYVFNDNTALEAGFNGREDAKTLFPEWFNMFAYNDEKQCLVFMGAYIEGLYPKDAQAVQANWDEFLQKHFSEFYDFSA